MADKAAHSEDLKLITEKMVTHCQHSSEQQHTYLIVSLINREFLSGNTKLWWMMNIMAETFSQAKEHQNAQKHLNGLV